VENLPRRVWNAPPVRIVTTRERRDRLARRHLLATGGAGGSVRCVADAVVALHATDPVSVYLAVGARWPGATVAEVDAALYEERSVVRHHAMRRTLWVMGPEALREAHAAATVRVAEVERRKLVDQLAAAGLGDPAGWLRAARTAVEVELRRAGPLTARQLGAARPELRLPVVLGAGTAGAAEVAAHTRVLLVLGFEGVLVRARPTGTWINGQYRWALLDEWVPGGVGSLDERAARASLVVRWLRAFGPGTTEDLVWWMGSTKAAARQALDDVGALPVVLEGGATGWLLPDDLDEEPAAGPWVALLPALDPTAMGWRERAWYLDPSHVPVLVDRNGNVGPTVWADGRVVGGWVQKPDGTIAVRFVEPVRPTVHADVAAAAGRVRELVGAARFRVRFPAPLQADLLGAGS
jgi:hypothetical protein